MGLEVDNPAKFCAKHPKLIILVVLATAVWWWAYSSKLEEQGNLAFSHYPYKIQKYARYLWRGSQEEHGIYVVAEIHKPLETPVTNRL